MADPEHLRIIKQGVEVWNEWKAENPAVKPNLRGTDLSNDYFGKVDLGGADLSGADLHGAMLRGADVSAADLTGADLRLATLVGVNLRAAKLNNVRVGETTFGDNDLSTVQGLETIIHIGPSTLGIDTLYNSEGKIPGSVLRGCRSTRNLHNLSFLSDYPTDRVLLLLHQLQSH